MKSLSVVMLGIVWLSEIISPSKTDQNPVHRAWFHNVDEVSRLPQNDAASQFCSFQSEIITPPMDWNELIVSWNAQLEPGQRMTIRARTVTPFKSRDYVMGIWSTGGSGSGRQSVPNQSDENGKVDTDTLLLNRPAKQLQLVVEITGPGSRLSLLKDLNISVLNSKLPKPEPLAPNKAAWGKQLIMAERSQLSYKGGRVWCSPTSLSMVMSYWAKQLKRPELDEDVTAVAGKVYDIKYDGTGNWPFNTAYAGSFSGIRGYITRFEDVSELEDWIEAGYPVIISVSYKLLKGMPTPETGGHIVVVSGFTDKGDVIVNDPWAKLETGEKVVKTFPRKNLIAGWAKSNNTVYLVHPADAKVPQSRFGHW